MDGAWVGTKPEVVHLGCSLNEDANTDRETSSRISRCMIVIKKLEGLEKELKVDKDI